MGKKIGKKDKQCVSIIGGADGPTTIFLARKDENPGLIQRMKNSHYKKKRSKTEHTIVAEPHTLEEVMAYLENTYGMVEVSKESDYYKEQRNSLKASLVIQHKPELLGDLATIETPEDFGNEKVVKDFLDKMQLRDKRAAEVPDELIPMDYHAYKMGIPGVGEIQVELDTVWNEFCCGYSQEGKGCKKLCHIVKDLYLYYGVTEEDIEKKTDRYSILVTALTE